MGLIAYFIVSCRLFSATLLTQIAARSPYKQLCSIVDYEDDYEVSKDFPDGENVSRFFLQQFALLKGKS